MSAAVHTCTPPILMYVYGKGQCRSRFKQTLKAHNFPLEGVMRLKQVPLDFSFRFPWGGILFSKLFLDFQKIKPWTIVHGFWPETEKFDIGQKRIPSERASQEEQNGANFSFIAPSILE